MKIKKIIGALAFTSILSASTLASISHADAPTAALTSADNSSQKSKNPQDEIARRMTIIKIAEGSDDEILIAEADIARAELVGYQNQRAQDASKPMEQSEVKAQMPATDQTRDYRGFASFIVGLIGAFFIGFSVRGFL